MKRFCILFSFLLIALCTTEVSAQTVDIMWEGQTYTPPFYKGLPLWGSQSGVVLYAVPDIQGTTNTSNLTYKWTRDNVVLGTVSGVGKNYLYLNDAILGKPQEVKVEVIGSDGGVLAQRTLTITPTRPELLVYEKNPLYGYLFNKEVGVGYRMSGQEITFTGFPLFFTTYSFNDPDLKYSWSTGNSSDTGPSVTYRIPESSSGTSRVNLKLDNSARLIQSATRNYLVEFGNR